MSKPRKLKLRGNCESGDLLISHDQYYTGRGLKKAVYINGFVTSKSKAIDSIIKKLIELQMWMEEV